MERGERPERTDLFALWFTAWTTQRLGRRTPQYSFWISKLWDSRSRRLKGFISSRRENRLPGSVLRKIPRRPDVRFLIAIALFIYVFPLLIFAFTWSTRGSRSINRIDRRKNRVAQCAFQCPTWFIVVTQQRGWFVPFPRRSSSTHHVEISR